MDQTFMEATESVSLRPTAPRHAVNGLRRYFRHGMLPQLLAFETCVRHGSVTRAARELGLAQPTVSCLVKKLSTHLGGPLTVIRDRRVEATELGHDVLVLCAEIRGAIERFDGMRAAPTR
jgi:DNA-binding transcriptional LysR family regulator